MSVIRHSMRDQVRESLPRRIGCGELLPGMGLRENSLAEELGVSSIPACEAIRELAVTGVVEAQSHRGAWVRVSLSETIEALQVRSSLDSQAADTLRGRFERLREIVAALIATAQQSDLVSFQEHNQLFHRLIILSSKNEVLLRVWDSLGFEVRTRAVKENLLACDPVEIATEHEAIVDALDLGVGALAAQLLSSLSRTRATSRGTEEQTTRANLP